MKPDALSPRSPFDPDAQALPGLAQELCELEPTLEGFGSGYQQVLGSLVQVAPSFSLRGGTPEIMRGIIAKGLGVR